MDEFVYSARHATELLEQLRLLDGPAESHSGGSYASQICSMSASSDDQAMALVGRLEAITRLKARRASDWLIFLMEINAILCRCRPALRTSSAILMGPESWMSWIAPPEDLRPRTLDVISRLLTRPFQRANSLAIFPALMLVHPFRDGNRRTAMIFLEAVNRCYPRFTPEELNRFFKYIRANQFYVIEAISQIRVFGDAKPYSNLIISLPFARESKVLGV